MINAPDGAEDNSRLYGAVDTLEAQANPPAKTALGPNGLMISAQNSAQRADLAMLIRRALADRSDLIITIQPDQSLSVAYTPGAFAAMTPKLTALADVLNERLHQLGLQNAAAVTTADGHLEVAFTSDADATQFKSALPNRPELTFREVDEIGAGRDHSAPPSPGDESVPQTDRGQNPLWLKPDIIIDNGMVAEAVGCVDQNARPAICLRLTAEGGRRVGAFTQANIGRRFAIGLDGQIVSAPVVAGAMSDRGEITGNFTTDEAKSLAASIMASAPDLPLKIVGER